MGKGNTCFMDMKYQENLPDLLFYISTEFPDHRIGFVHPDRSIRFITFPELLNEALSKLSGMQTMGIRMGDKVILSLERSEEIIPVLWACFIGGIIPALLQPPITFTEYNPAAEKIEKVFHLMGGPYVVLSHKHTEIWQSSQIPRNRLIDVVKMSGDPKFANRAKIQSTDLALIQFSSGSTGDPKGVMLSHKNIIVNTKDIIKAISVEPEDIQVSWMPLYHDMGLIGFHLTPLFAGATQYFIDPIDFIKNPGLWIETMSQKKCTITACPNFGQIIVNRYLGRKIAYDWDLSSLRILFNAAEPISVSTMQTFINRLKAFNFNAVAMFPAYGLAEATLAVTFSKSKFGAEVRAFRRDELIREGVAIEANQGDTNIIELVNLGCSLDHCIVMLTDDNMNPINNGKIGNVVVKGENITKGYYGNEDGTANLFSGEWLLTGDLGFFHKGDLFITGRSKDIIFINGMNYYSHDLETIALQLDELSYGKVIVTGYFDESECRDRILIFIVGSDNEIMNSICEKIKNHFSTIIGLKTETFILVRSHDIPRTSSGKIQRYKLVDRFKRGDFIHVIQK